MGNHKFRLSDIIPNVWFQKLRGKKKTQTPPFPSPSLSSSFSNSSSLPAPPPKAQLSDQRKSYHFTRDLNSPSEPPRKSARRRRRSTKRNRDRPPPPRRFISSPVSAACTCSCRATTMESAWPTKPPEEYRNSHLSQTSTSDNDSLLPEYGSDRGLMTPDTFDGTFSWSTSCKCSNDKDMEINAENDNPLSHEFDSVSEQSNLPPIITKKQEPTKIQRTSAEFSEKNAHGSLSLKVVKEEFYRNKKSTSPIRRYLPNPSSPGMKLRTNSPRIANRRIQGGRKSASSLGSRSSSVSESFAVVKSSKDPGKDFRESMVEMITENNIRASTDLEELLACYLSLNSDEYHEIIINVFKQIWFDYLHFHLK